MISKDQIAELRKANVDLDSSGAHWHDLLDTLEALYAENDEYKKWQTKVEGGHSREPSTTINRRARIAYLERYVIKLERVAEAAKVVEINTVRDKGTSRYLVSRVDMVKLWDCLAALNENEKS